MGESHDLMSLDWVQADIEQSLTQAQEALEAYLEDDVSAHLQTSYDAVHQVHGSLQMAGVQGAIMLAEQLETLLQAMLDETIEDRESACNALAQALVYMPSYLNRIKSHGEDSPALLHAVMNDVREVLGEEPVDELELFNPNLGEARERASAEVKARFDQVSQADLRKLRQVYQFSLIGLIRQEDQRLNIARLSNALARLQQICQDAPINQLWEVSTAFVESLLTEGVELNVRTLDLLRGLEREIKEFIHAGVFALDRQAHPIIMKGMLYWIAKSSQIGPHIQSIRQAYNLDRYELSDAYGKKTNRLAGPDPEVFRTVAAALSEELVRLKDSVDLYVRSEDKANVDVTSILPGLKQVASTLIMLNFEAPRLVIQEQIDALTEQQQSSKEISEIQLLQLAEALLFVEAELETLGGTVQGVDEQVPPALVGAAAEAVINESLSSLRKAKEMMHAFLADENNFNLLETAPNTLRSAYGGLSILALSAPAQLLLSASQYIEDDILARQRMPDEEAIEALAEVMASVEFCLEGVANQQPVNHAVLARASEQIAKLGYPVEQKEGISSDETQFEPEVSQFTDTTGDEDTFETPEVDAGAESLEGKEAWQISGNEPDELIIEGSEIAETSESQVGAPSVMSLQEFGWDAGETETTETSELATEQDTVVDESLQQADIAEPEAETLEENDDDLIDEEILEIFTEEAQEVFEEIDNHWPLYVADNGHEEALKETRRAFHTLKGSGRMVKADVISELAWSVENMLNRLIEGEIPASSAICELVNDIRPALPSLLAHFEARTTPDIDVQQWRDRADALAAGETGVIETQVEPLVNEGVSLEPGTFEELDSLDADEQAASEFEAFEEVHLEALPEEQDGFEDELLSAEATLTDDDEIDFAGELEPETGVELPEQLEYTSTAQAAVGADTDSEEDSEAALYKLFVKEAEQHLAIVEAFVNEASLSAEPVFISDELYRALHTLDGSAKMAMLDVFAGIAEPTEQLVLALINAERPADTEIQQALRTAHGMMVHAASLLPDNPSQPIEGSEEFVERLLNLCQNYAATTDDTEKDSEAQALIRNHVDTICELTDGYEQWRETANSKAPQLVQLQKNAEQLIEAADAIQLPALQELLVAMAQAFADIAAQRVELNDGALAALDDANNGVIRLFDEVAASQAITDTRDLVERLARELQPVVDEPADQTDETATDWIDKEDVIEESGFDEEPDAELIEIFLEEAEEILELASSAKQNWIDNSADAGALDQLQRCLHTLKGGARMAGIMGVGNLSHELESVYEDVAAGKLPLNADLYDLVHACDDRIMDMLSELRTNLRCEPALDIINQVREFRASGGVISSQAASDESVTELLKTLTSHVAGSRSADDADQALTEISKDLTAFQDAAYAASLNEPGDLCHIFREVLASVNAADLTTDHVQDELAEWLERLENSLGEALELQQLDAPDLAANAMESTPDIEPQPLTESPDDVQDARKVTQDNVRVSASLLEQLVDLAGETSVSRARVEQQVNNYGYAIDEVGSTVERLREQLRRMENETETQILFRQEREGPAHEGFDPLEMDRYSRMQELSRALMESVSDLLDLKETLRDQVRVTENLLLQQSRTNTELHEGLMKARMVPFSRLVPRLRRLVRQVSGELNKRIDVDFVNPDTELDRSLLEHMTAPLEHMLRNAVDHGVETVAQREAVGKSATGKVTLSLSRDGGDIVLKLQDDGAGIAIDKVKAKAIERGLMTADAKLTDHEVLQFILQQGFSTAEKVTQISGRGVGMDVVSSEIRQLGGSITIDSESGQGTLFTVRLPFTVSISRSLMVNVGEEMFALPLNSIEGVVRVNPYELEEYFKEDGPEFEYAGVKYDLHYLGDFVERAHGYQPQGGVLPLPVILVRTADHAIAVQVDSISGSREVVVKPLGQQFNNVPGMSGATILGDGRVVLILDMAAMVREHLAREHIEPVDGAAETAVASGRLQVMVVDDSVTVRKVASRLLERHGMEVIVAKDGVEAMTKLQEVVPSIMLLDIEMPRMDGFELASLVRHDENLKDIPIIMISSRTGDKHQTRAREIGVNQFMGKPFQESELLEGISNLTGAVFEAESA